MAPLEDRCDVVICRGQTGATQTFPLGSGGVLRIGRGMANDVVLDFNGVSVYHCELYLRPSAEPGQAGKQLLCIRDSAKNGTGVRPGPHSLAADPSNTNPAWEPLKRDALRVLEHGWQLMVPLRSRKESLQLPEAWRCLTVFIGKAPPGVGIPASEDLDGEAWEPFKGAIGKLVAPAFGTLPPPPPPDLGGGAFEEAPPPPPMPVRGVPAVQKKPVENQMEAEVGSEDEKEARKRAKKDKKAKKKDGRAATASGSEDEGRKEKKDKKKDKKAKKRADQEEESDDDEDDKKKDKKKDKKAKKRQGRESSAGSAASAEELAPADRKAREKEDRKKKEREERIRLEQELEDELAVEMNRGMRGKKKDDGDDNSSVYTYAPGKKKGEDESEMEEDDDLKSAWSRALAPSEIEAKRVARDRFSAVASDRGSSAASAKATVASANSVPVAQVLAVVEVLDSSAGTGIFLRCGTHGGQPVFRRLRDEKEPMLLYFWDGSGESSCAGWYIAVNFDKKGQDDYQDFWKTEEPKLPAAGKGECGGRMEARGQLDGPALSELAKLPEQMATSVRSAFKAAVAGAKGIPEEEGVEIVADAASKPAPPSPTAGSDISALPPWKRRKVAAAAKSEAVAAEAAASAIATGAAAETEKKPDEPAADEAGKERAADAAGEDAPMADAEGAKADTPAAAAAESAPEEKEQIAEGDAKAPEEAAVVETPAEAVAEAAVAEKPEEAAEEAPAKAAEVEKAPEVAAPAAEAEAAAPEEPAKEAAAEAKEVEDADKAPDESEATNTELAKAAATEGGDGTEPAGTHAAGADDEGAPTEVARRAAAEDVSQDDRESIHSLTTNPQKTVPGDRAPSLAATSVPPGEEVPARKPGKRGAGLTTEALEAHTKALARAQAEAYAATFAQARSHYSKSAPGKSVAGRTVAGMSIAGRSIVGKSIGGVSIAGRSIAASGIAPTERTFRTHLTTRELLMGGSEMRELMRSVSPISEPGVQVKPRKGKRGRKSPMREQTPLISATREASGSRGEKKKKKKKKDKKATKDKAGKKKRPLATQSPSHYEPVSPTPQRPGGSVDASATPNEDKSGAQSGTSHWKGNTEPSQTVYARAAKPKKGARAREAPPSSEEEEEDPGGARKRKSGKVELRGREDGKRKRK